MDDLFEQNLFHLESRYHNFFRLQKISMILAGGMVFVLLCGWFIPAVGSVLPNGWRLMHPGTALSVLLSAIAIMVIQRNWTRWTVDVIGLVVIIVVTITLLDVKFEQFFRFSNGITVPGEDMSGYTAAFFCILVFSFVVAPRSNYTGIGSKLRDFFTLMLIGIVLIIFSGYFFNMTSLEGPLIKIHVDPLTFFAMCLLTFGNFVRGIHIGIFSPFMGSGISSYTAQVTLPWVLLGPFAILSAVDFFAQNLDIPPPDQTAITAVLLSLMLFFIILWTSNRISYLENDLHKLALTDEMTGLYNQRAFCILGKHAFLESQRSDSLLVLLYFDLDGLKKINDTLGHQIGSEMIIKFTDLLKANFRRNETIARLGGDEFVVLSKQNEMGNALKRLAEATEAANKGGMPYTISYSHGIVSGKAKDYASIDELLEKADALMYENKSRKKNSAQNQNHDVSQGAGN